MVGVLPRQRDQHELGPRLRAILWERHVQQFGRREDGCIMLRSQGKSCADLTESARNIKMSAATRQVQNQSRNEKSTARALRSSFHDV